MLASRLALPLVLSLIAHGALVGLLLLLPGALPERNALDTEVVEAALPLRIGALPPEESAPAPTSSDEGIPVDVEPRVRPAPELEGATLAFPDRHGTEAPGAAPSTLLGGPALSPGAGGAGGPGLFPVGAQVRSVVYVLDRSLSMGPSGALEAARRELRASLRRLAPTTNFQVVPYNRGAELLIAAPSGLVPAGAGNVELAGRLLEDVQPSGSTDHGRALRCGLALRPEVLYFVTDADDLTPAEVRDATRFNRGRTIVHVLELSRAQRGRDDDNLLRRLAEENRGAYRRVAPGG